MFYIKISYFGANLKLYFVYNNFSEDLFTFFAFIEAQLG
ncbi:hypothetical protein AsAng_0060570 [Aureispira anguillae]|uniref:Uncharacterized protein n=1 Tax=Aureispira anguillae TaxID=2864201 RepID=A0A915YM29_9BACT|nr:hypothetical protein AsAng_0060570 [Aureispira anguillae]